MQLHNCNAYVKKDQISNNIQELVSLWLKMSNLI